MHEVSTYAELNVWLIDTDRSRYAGSSMRQRQRVHYDLARPRVGVKCAFPAEFEDGVAPHAWTLCLLSYRLSPADPFHTIDTFVGICRRMGYCDQYVLCITSLAAWKAIARDRPLILLSASRQPGDDDCQKSIKLASLGQASVAAEQ